MKRFVNGEEIYLLHMHELPEGNVEINDKLKEINDLPHFEYLQKQIDRMVLDFVLRENATKSK